MIVISSRVRPRTLLGPHRRPSLRGVKGFDDFGCLIDCGVAHVQNALSYRRSPRIVQRPARLCAGPSRPTVDANAPRVLGPSPPLRPRISSARFPSPECRRVIGQRPRGRATGRHVPQRRPRAVPCSRPPTCAASSHSDTPCSDRGSSRARSVWSLISNRN